MRRKSIIKDEGCEELELRFSCRNKRFRSSAWFWGYLYKSGLFKSSQDPRCL